MRTSRRAERIEPFYVMEVAKAASTLAREVAHTDRPMIFLNIGEPDFTAPPLVQEAANRAIAGHHEHRPRMGRAEPQAAGDTQARAVAVSGVIDGGLARIGIHVRAGREGPG